MKLTFVDTNSELVETLKREFQAFPEITVLHGDLLTFARNCVVSPANSYGFMDGGVDKDLLAFFGTSLQEKVTTIISQRVEGHLPVGASALVATGHPLIPHLILAPTMETPEFIPAGNVYRAMRAAIRLIQQHRDVLTEVYCPGLGTGVGGVPPDLAAPQMLEAFRDGFGRS